MEDPLGRKRAREEETKFCMAKEGKSGALQGGNIPREENKIIKHIAPDSGVTAD